MEELKREIMAWSGLQLEGSTKQELRESIESIQWNLECEINQQAKKFKAMVETLNIPEN